MSLTFAGTVSPDCVTFTGIDGRNIVVSKSHPNNTKIREEIKTMQRLRKTSNDTNSPDIQACWQRLTDLSDIPTFVAKRTQGLVQVRDGVVFYGDEVLHNSITRRILWGLGEGYDMDSYIRLLENLMENPSKRAVDELFDFLEACNMGITEDGHFLAYKNVRSDYRDIHSGKFDNSVGQILEMARNKVDEDKNRTCSTGFHFCSQSYLPHFSSTGGHTMIVKINPRDVVAIPADYQNAKGRAARYEVVAEYRGPGSDDPLSRLPVWTNQDVQTHFDETGSDDESYDAELDYWDEDDADADEAFDDHEEDDVFEIDDDFCEFCNCGPACDYCGCDGECEYDESDSDEFPVPAIPDVSYDRKDVQVSTLPEGGVKATFNFADNGIRYNFDLKIDSTGTPALVVQEYHPRMVKHDEIAELAGKTSTELDRNAVIKLLRANGETEFRTPAQAMAEYRAIREENVKPKSRGRSSFIESVSYDHGILLVTFASGAVAEYYRVPRNVYEAFEGAESRGQFFNENIRDQYEWNYI